ncbi:MAG TPA: LapA family protein [Burkholderiales bacterium]
MAEREGPWAVLLRWGTWALRLLLFLLVLGFALKNSDTVTVRYYLGYEWQASLVLVLLAFFGVGIALGLLACLPALFRQRRRIARLEREAAARSREAAARPPPPDILH